MVRGKVQSKSKKSVSSKNKSKHVSPKIRQKANDKRKSKVEESDSQMGTDDSEPEIVVKKSVGRQRKDANAKASPATEKKSVGPPKKRKHGSESAVSTDEESSVGRRKKNVKTKVSRSAKKPSAGRPKKRKQRRDSSESAVSTDEESSVGRRKKNVKTKVSRSAKKPSAGRPKKRKQRRDSSESAVSTDEESSVGRQKKNVKTKVSRSAKKPSAGRPKKRKQRRDSSESAVSSDEEFSAKKKSAGRPKKRKHRKDSSESAVSTNDETDEEGSVDGSKDDENKESSEGEQSNPSDSNRLSSNKPSEDEDNFEVEDIMDFKVEEDKKYFLIRWKGYGSGVDSWEKERSLNCPDLIEKFYEEHPEARISSTKRKQKYDSDYEVSSSNSSDNYDISKIKRSITVKRNGKNLTRVEDYSSSDEESESEVDTEDLEPKVKRSVGRPKNPITNVSSSTKNWIIGRPRKHGKSDDEEEEERYEVEEIIDFEIEDEIKYFLVRWKGYDSSADSWEKHRSLNCPELITKFYKERPEARVSATKKPEYNSDDEGSSSGSEYDPTYYEQLTMKDSVKRRGKKSTRNRTSGRETNVTSTVSGTDEPEPEVKEKKTVGHTRKEDVANVSLSTKKRSVGRSKIHEKRSVGRSKVNHKESPEAEEEADRSDSDVSKSSENYVLS